MEWNSREVSGLIQAALRAVANEEPLLPLGKKISEETVVARIAHHLALTLESSSSPIKVDVEYDIDPYGDGKWLIANAQLLSLAAKLKRKIHFDDGVEYIEVVPDIVIHKRESNEMNLVVIEVKFNAHGPQQHQYARLKLEAFQRPPFSYQLGFLVTLPQAWKDFYNSENIKLIPKVETNKI